MRSPEKAEPADRIERLRVPDRSAFPLSQVILSLTLNPFANTANLPPFFAHGNTFLRDLSLIENRVEFAIESAQGAKGRKNVVVPLAGCVRPGVRIFVRDQLLDSISGKCEEHHGFIEYHVENAGAGVRIARTFIAHLDYFVNRIADSFSSHGLSAFKVALKIVQENY